MHKHNHNNNGRIDCFNQEKLNKIGIYKRNIFRKQISDQVEQFYTIGECCITENDYPNDFKKSILSLKRKDIPIWK